MKILFFLSVCMVFMSSCQQTAAQVKNISQKDFFKHYKSDKKLQILDVRTPEEFNQGYIEGAILIDYRSKNFIAITESKLDKNKPIYIYCAVGGRSYRATKKLMSAGFTEVYNLEGGYEAWKTKQN